MDKHWRTNCTGNKYCDMSFKDYIKLKNNPPSCYFTKKAIRQYEILRCDWKIYQIGFNVSGNLEWISQSQPSSFITKACCINEWL
uniref:Uncharacterized protein n=1 Tax=Rhizophagus irregularis (strain DAOM 181602 / DAOM 197198 / MUCL 43194) TaxID=747089 RepID=U9STX8_RHIID